MNEEQRDPDEEQQPRRPRVVDKRIAARRAAEESARPGAPGGAPAGARRDDAPPAGEVRGPGEGPGPVKTPAGAPPPAEEETFRPPRQEEAPPSGQEVWTPEQEAEAQRIVAEIERVPARDWVVNSAMNLVNVASVKLDAGGLQEAQLAIDALAAILDSTGARLGDANAPLRQVLAQLQMAYAQAIQPGPPGSPGGGGRGSL